MPIEQISMQSIRAWLEAHPAQAADILNQNPSYVFFREDDDLRPDQGPPGVMGVPLTPGRSVAVDRAFIPLGAPVFVATTDPVSGEKLQRCARISSSAGAMTPRTGPARCASRARNTCCCRGRSPPPPGSRGSPPALQSRHAA
jgi:membrane-bound lytic murein transglycosylase A